jgi:hypothetical protein
MTTGITLRKYDKNNKQLQKSQAFGFFSPQNENSLSFSWNLALKTVQNPAT